MTRLRQVTKEEYEVLTRFHPGEVRYYIDFGKTNSRRSVTKKAAKKSSKKKSKKPISGRRTGVNYQSGRAPNSGLRLVNTEAEFKEGTMAQNLYRLVKLKFERDPTKVIGRTDLKDDIVNTSVYSDNQVGPFLSDLLKTGILKYHDSEAASAS